jgi:hypothetical protein
MLAVYWNGVRQDMTTIITTGSVPSPFWTAFKVKSTDELTVDYDVTVGTGTMFLQGVTGPQGLIGPTGTTLVLSETGTAVGAVTQLDFSGMWGVPIVTGTVGFVQFPIHPFQITFTMEGNLIAAPGSIRFYNLMGTAKQVVGVMAAVANPPANQPILVDIHQNGTTIFTNQAHRPSIGTGTNTAWASGIDVPTWPTGTYLTMDVDQIGSGTVGGNLSVFVVYQ